MIRPFDVMKAVLADPALTPAEKVALMGAVVGTDNGTGRVTHSHTRIGKHVGGMARSTVSEHLGKEVVRRYFEKTDHRNGSKLELVWRHLDDVEPVGLSDWSEDENRSEEPTGSEETDGEPVGGSDRYRSEDPTGDRSEDPTGPVGGSDTLSALTALTTSALGSAVSSDSSSTLTPFELEDSSSSTLEGARAREVEEEAASPPFMEAAPPLDANEEDVIDRALCALVATFLIRGTQNMGGLYRVPDPTGGGPIAVRNERELARHLLDNRHDVVIRVIEDGTCAPCNKAVAS